MIEIKNLSFNYGFHNILENINFSIKKKEFISIIGHNGSGKTTLIKLIIGLLKPKKGKIHINEIESGINKGRKTSSYFGYINQGSIQTNLPITVEEVINIGNLKNLPEEIYLKTLDLMGIINLKGRLFKSLSGGQKQKVNIARCLIQHPEVMILDEPNSYLDNNSKIEIMELLKKLNKENGITIIMISHDLLLVKEYSDRIFILENKNIKEINKNLTPVTDENRELLSILKGS